MRKATSIMLVFAIAVSLLLAGCGLNESAEASSGDAAAASSTEAAVTDEPAAEEPTEAGGEDAVAKNAIPEEYAVAEADETRMIEADGTEADDQNPFWCVVDKFYQNDDNASAGNALLNDPQKVLKDLDMRYPEEWAVKVMADVRMEGETDKYSGGEVTLRFTELNGKGRICAAGYIDGQWVRGVIEKATDEYADVRFEKLPALAVLFFKPHGGGFSSPDASGNVGEEGRIIEVTEWPFELQDEYWCVVDQEYQTEEDKEAAEKLLEDPAAHIAEFVEGDGSDWKLILLVDVRLEGNTDKYDGSPITVAFPEVRADQEVRVLHFADGEWHEETDKYVTEDYIGVRFASLSPVAFFVYDK